MYFHGSARVCACVRVHACVCICICMQYIYRYLTCTCVYLYVIVVFCILSTPCPIHSVCGNLVFFRHACGNPAIAVSFFSAANVFKHIQYGRSFPLPPLMLLMVIVFPADTLSVWPLDAVVCCCVSFLVLWSTYSFPSSVLIHGAVTVLFPSVLF